MSTDPRLHVGDPAPSLAHNMSVPPKTVVRYQGLDSLCGYIGFGGSGVGMLKYSSAGPHGFKVRFRLPPDFEVGDAARIWAALGHGAVPDPDAALVALIEDRARDLPLPDACAVTPRTGRRMPFAGDVLAALAILTKCSARVWLRSKTPNLTTLHGRRDVTLLIPPTYRDRLVPETHP
jgi:hypothetical protein